MRLIDATRIEQYILNNCSDNEEINAIYAEIINAPTIEPSITYEQVIEYCRRRCLIIVTAELFNDMKAIWNLLRKADNWEEPEINPCRCCTDYDGHGGCKSNGGCGAKMNEEINENETG